MFKRAVFVFLIVYLFSAGQLLAQTGQGEWRHKEARERSYPADRYFKAVASGPYVRKSLERDRPLLLQQAKEELSLQILSHISVSSQFVLEEEGEEMQSSYREKTSVRTDIDLSGVNTLFYSSKREKRNYALAYVLKWELGQFYRQRMEQACKDGDMLLQGLEEVKREYEKSAEYEKKRNLRERVFHDLEELRVVLVKLERQEQVVRLCGMSPTGAINKDMGRLMKQQKSFRNFFAGKELYKLLSKGEEALANKDYLGALAAFQSAAYQDPLSERAQKGIVQAKKARADELYFQAKGLFLSLDCPAALDTVNESLTYYNTSEAFLLKEQIEKKYFKELADELKRHMRNRSMAKAEEVMNKLKKFYRVNLAGFNSLSSEYSKLAAEIREEEKRLEYARLINQARIELARKQYEEAFRLVEKAEELAPKANQAVRLRQEIKHEHFLHRKKQALKKVPFKYCLRLGAGAYTHLLKTSSLNLDTLQRSSWNPMFTAGLFRKLKIRRNFRNGNDFSSALLVGLFLDAGSFRVNLKDQTLNREVIKKNFYYQLEGGAYFFETLRLSAGMLKGFSSQEDHTYLSTTLGLSARLGYLCIQANYTQLYRLEDKSLLSENETNFQSKISLGVSYQFNFYRKLSSLKKEELRLGSGLD
ncbi:MAG: hypothetical protein MI784_05150 [Cytophagales bacterium]|nr:hypothetical protein [Cytophagales bacterium]